MRGVVIVLLAGSACSFSNRVDGPEMIDAPPPDSARVRPPPGACGEPGAIADDFADGAPSPVWSVANPSRVVEAAGRLVVSPLAGAIDEGSGYTSNPYVDLRDAAAEVEVRTMVDAGARAYFRFAHGSESFGFTYAGGQLAIGRAGSTIDVAYDPIAHRHWRVSHAASMVAFEASPDGFAWATDQNGTAACDAFYGAHDLWRIRETGGTLYFETAPSTTNAFRIVHQTPVPFPLTAMRPYFGTVTDRAIGQSINLSIDRFN